MAQDTEQLILSISADTAQMRRALTRLTADTGKATKTIENQFSSMGKNITGQFSGLARTLAGSFLAVFGAGALFKGFIDNSIESQNTVKQLEAVLKSTSGIAGVTADAALLLSSSLQKVTTYGDEAITSAESLLLTFTKIGRDVFPDAVKIVLDMSTALGQDLKASAIQVGKALQDPVLGVTALRKVGVNFSASQQALIKSLVNTGQAAKAQALILKELQTEFGGSAQAARQTLGGALTALKQAFGDLFELGGPATESLRVSIEGLNKALSDPQVQSAVAALGSVIVDAFTKVVQEAGDVAKALQEIETAFEHLSGSTGLTAFLGFVDQVSDKVDRLVQVAADLGHMIGSDVVGQVAGAQPYIGQNRIQERIIGAFDGASYSTPKGDRVPAAKPYRPPPPDIPPPGKTHGIKKTAEDAFNEDVKSIRDRTAALKEEQATLGMSYLEQQKRKVALDLEQQALKDVQEAARKKGDTDWQNAKLTPGQVAQIDEVADAYARQADSLKNAQDSLELRRDVLKGVFDDLRSALQDGKLDWQDFSNIALNALNKIVDKIENDLIDSLLQVGSSTGKGGGGILGGLLGLFGFRSGGYTGSGGANQPAGVVHGGEYVFSKAAVDKAGVGNLDAMHKSLKGYASGGYVAPTLPRISSGASQERPVVITVVGDEGGTFVPRVTQISGQTAGVVVRQSRPQLANDSVNAVQQASRKRPGLFR